MIFIFTSISLHACMKRACTEIFVWRGFWWCKTFPWGLGFVGVCKLTVERRSLNSELWHACAGPLVGLPAVGSRVVYFPQGHTEQVKQNWFFLFLLLVFLAFDWFFWVTATGGCPHLEGKLFVSCNSWWNWSSATCTPTGVDKLLAFFLPPPTCYLLQIWSKLSWAFVGNEFFLGCCFNTERSRCSYSELSRSSITPHLSPWQCHTTCMYAYNIPLLLHLQYYDDDDDDDVLVIVSICFQLYWVSSESVTYPSACC
jgi:hypothetical protein